MGIRQPIFFSLAFTAFFIFSIGAYAQDQLEIKMGNIESGVQYSEVLEELETKHSLKIFFIRKWFENRVTTKNYQDYTIRKFLEDIFKDTDFSFYSLYNHAIVIVKDPTNEMQRLKSIQNALRKEQSIDQFQFGTKNETYDNKEVVLTGTIRDLKTGDPLPNAIMSINDVRGTVSDTNGRYELKLKKGEYLLKVDFVNYEQMVMDLKLYEDGEMDISLDKDVTLLNEIVVESRANVDLVTKRVGEIQLSVIDMKRAPTFLGETDLIKQIQYLPGVVTVGEAATGFNVRGGSVDQNLILYDNLPVFNSSHVFGFLTSFNPESIGSVSFFNGGIPARYGGRASSVLDIKSINPSQDKIEGQAGIGLFTSNIMLTAPIKENKSSMFASLRTTYSDWLTTSIRTDYADLSNSSIGFYDASLKYTDRIKDKSRLSVSAYSSRDKFSLAGDTTYRWSNTVISTNLDHEFQNGIRSNFTAGSSIYSFQISNKDPLNASELSYRIINSLVRADFNKQYGQYNISAGWEANYYVFSPGKLKPLSDLSTAQNVTLDKKHTLENAFYISNEWDLDGSTKVEAGLRLPIFASFGKSEVFRYQDGLEKNQANIVDTLRFDSNLDVIKAYAGIEPRVSIVRTLDPSSSVKFGYHRIYQYLHLISNSVAVAPSDIWLPSGYHFKPQRSDQFSIGYFKDVKQKAYVFTNEVFYKLLNNVIDFKRGSDLVLNPNLETELLQGKGTSYGFETSITKNSGRLTGSLNYTYSRSFRKIAGDLREETINRGEKYPTNFDQPHVLNLSWNYKISKRHFFTGNFTYHTGRPVTVPVASLAFENTTLAYFSRRNEFRIPNYHRLDFAFVIEGNHKLKKWWNGTWVISVYNVYARRNPYSVFFRRDAEQDIPRPFQLSIVGTIFPSLTYKLDF